MAPVKIPSDTIRSCSEINAPNGDRAPGLTHGRVTVFENRPIFSNGYSCEFKLMRNIYSSPRDATRALPPVVFDGNFDSNSLVPIAIRLLMAASLSFEP